MNTLKEIFSYRQMISSLVRRDLRGRYKGSFLGFLWTFINPLLQLLVYTAVFSLILRTNIERYYLYLFVGLIPWIFFSSSLTGGAASVVAQKDLIKKIYFPRQVIPISYVTSCFINMLLSFIAVFAVMIVSGAGIYFPGLVCLPVIMAAEYLLALGAALLTSAVTVYFRDLEHILGIFSMAWMYMTPIMYDRSIVPQRLMPVFRLNPMTHVIECYRAVLYYKCMPDMKGLLSAAGLGIVFLVAGHFVFLKLQKRFAEEL